MNVKGLFVRLRIDSQGLDAEFTASSVYSQSDFASVGDQNLADH
tara:strand:- start:282 stop:413 length:132 start_codon:yes stop_codon:yes gene_type:complete